METPVLCAVVGLEPAAMYCCKGTAWSMAETTRKGGNGDARSLILQGHLILQGVACVCCEDGHARQLQTDQSSCLEFTMLYVMPGMVTSTESTSDQYYAHVCLMPW